MSANELIFHQGSTNVVKITGLKNMTLVAEPFLNAATINGEFFTKDGTANCQIHINTGTHN